MLQGVRVKIITAVKIELVVFRIVPCSVVVGYQCFREPCCLHLHGWSHKLWRWRQHKV